MVPKSDMAAMMSYLEDLKSRNIIEIVRVGDEEQLPCVPSKLAILPTFKFTVNGFDFELKPENYLKITEPDRNPDEKQNCKIMFQES